MSNQQQMQALTAHTEAAWIKSVMDSTRRYASAWALIGSPLDDGTASDLADTLRSELHSLLCFSPAAALLQRMLSPSDLGHAVSAEVRDLVRQVLGMKAVETLATGAGALAVSAGTTLRQALQQSGLHAYIREDDVAGLICAVEFAAIARAQAQSAQRDQVQRLLAENEQLRAQPGLRRVPVIPADVLNMVDRPAGTTGSA